MERNEMVAVLIENLRYINRGREGLEAFIEKEAERYERMSDLQIQNLFIINC